MPDISGINRLFMHGSQRNTRYINSTFISKFTTIYAVIAQRPDMSASAFRSLNLWTLHLFVVFRGATRCPQSQLLIFKIPKDQSALSCILDSCQARQPAEPASRPRKLGHRVTADQKEGLKGPHTHSVSSFSPQESVLLSFHCFVSYIVSLPGRQASYPVS